MSTGSQPGSGAGPRTTRSGGRWSAACTSRPTTPPLLVDPLVPPEDSERFLEYLDADVERAGADVHILLTVYWHVRSARDLVRALRAHRSGRPPGALCPSNGEPSSRPTPSGPATRCRAASRHTRQAVPPSSSTACPQHRAIVVGDVLLGDPIGASARPAGVGKGGQKAVREALRPLLELPLDRVLVSHGGIRAARRPRGPRRRAGLARRA